MAEESLKNKAVGGAAWSAIENVSRYGITFVVSIVLARILSPEDYGLIGILNIFLSLFNAIVDSGFTAAIIRKKDATEDDYSTAFFTNFLLSVSLTAIMFFASGPIASFFERPELVPLAKVMSVILIINALALVPRAKLTKAIDFKTQTKITFISSLISGAIGILLAISGFGVWSLVWQQLANHILATILLWYYGRWFPKFYFSLKSFKDLWGFGWKLLVSSLIGTIWEEIYQVVIGKCYSPAVLGLYTRAYQFSSLCSTNINAVVQKVSYPVLSVIQDDVNRLKNGYKQVIKITMLVTFVLMIGMAATAKSMILVLIGQKWIDCVPLLQLICFNMMLYPLNALNLNAIEVVGRSDIILKLRIIKTIIAVIPLVIGIFISIYWMLASSIIVGWFGYLLNAYYLRPLLDYSIREQINDVLPSFIVAAGMGIVVFLESFIPVSEWLLFPLQVLTGGVLVCAISEIIKLKEYLNLKSIIIKYIKRK